MPASTESSCKAIDVASPGNALYECRDALSSSHWRFIASEKGRGEMEELASEGVYASKGNRLHSPTIACDDEPFELYRLHFRSRFGEDGHYAITFQDADGQDQVDDIYGRVYKSADWAEQTVCFRGREGARTFRLQFLSHGEMAVRDVTVEHVDPAAAVQWADQLYAALPPLMYTPPTPRWQHLPRTMQKLRHGGTLRVVMLGDSIINDTSNANWEVLVGRHYPNGCIQVVNSIRGSTGCWYYRQEQHLRSYVFDQQPDLLMIGGISHRQDPGAIRHVIQATQRQLDCDILLMSGPMGPDSRPHDPDNVDQPLEPTACQPDPFNAQLAALAAETEVEFLDMNAIWHNYLASSRTPWQWFHRDDVHANDRGKQILGRILERYFRE